MQIWSHMLLSKYHISFWSSKIQKRHLVNRIFKWTFKYSNRCLQVAEVIKSQIRSNKQLISPRERRAHSVAAGISSSLFLLVFVWMLIVSVQQFTRIINEDLLSNKLYPKDIFVDKLTFSLYCPKWLPVRDCLKNADVCWVGHVIRLNNW